MTEYHRDDRGGGDDGFRGLLRQRMAQCGSRLCVGLDPDLSQIGGFLGGELCRLGIAAFLRAWHDTVLRTAARHAAAVKFQSAFYEALGLEGWRSLMFGIAAARDLGLVTVLDAKRGDIASTMRAYGESAFGGLGADALTVTPYMGSDCLVPLLPWLQRGCGVYIVWKTSNPSHTEYQDRALRAGGVVADAVLDGTLDWAREYSVEAGVGFVVGANHIAPSIGGAGGLVGGHARLAGGMVLVPGLGAQGGRFEALAALVTEVPLALPTASRAITGIGLASPGDPLALARSWEDYAAAVSAKCERINGVLGAP